jgi:outer membrane protein assembly factor BamB
MGLPTHFTFMRPLKLLAAMGLGASILVTNSGAENWPQWRGPFFNGSTLEKNLPVTWSKTENVAWTAPLPGPSGSSPIVWGDSVFVSSPDPQKNLNLLCIDRRDGKNRWQKQVAVGDKTVGRNNMTSPSPVTDGKAVYALYGTSDLAAFDFDGNELWKRKIGKDYGKFSIMWLYGSSPVLYQGKLYVQVLQRNPPDEYAHAIDTKPTRESYLLCIDPKTGKDLWRRVRQTDSTKESQEAYTTPFPYEGKNGPELIIVGGDHVSAHSAQDGKEIWRARLYEKRDDWYRIVTSPVAADGLIYASGPKGQPVVALKDGGKGDVTKSQVAWTFKEASTDWSTPLLYQGKLFILDGGKRILSCLDPRTGEKKWSGSLGAQDTFWSSPTGADGKIYCLSERGTVMVADAGESFKILASIPMGEEPCRSSVAASQGQLFIRTAKNLYCVGKK